MERVNCFFVFVYAALSYIIQLVASSRDHGKAGFVRFLKLSDLLVECSFILWLVCLILVFVMLCCGYSEGNPASHGRSSSFRATYSSTGDTEVRAFGASCSCLLFCPDMSRNDF